MYRISPLWWPVLAASSPVLLPALWIRYRTFKNDIAKVRQLNQERISRAGTIDLPKLAHLKITVLAEEEARPGFKGVPGISYKIESDLGAILFDVGYGHEDPALEHNAGELGFRLDQVDAVAISHLHPDHMGGFKAVKTNTLKIPERLGSPGGMPCFMPGQAAAPGFETRVVTDPRLLAAGIASTGPLSRSLFLMGRTDEQSLVASIKDKGVVVITGCGHPTLEKILQMTGAMAREPVYAVCGGLHLPVTDSPLRKPGLKVQMIWGTGKPPWKKITDEDVDRNINSLNKAGVRKVLLSRHDCCAYSAKRMARALKAEVSILRAGAVYEL